MDVAMVRVRCKDLVLTNASLVYSSWLGHHFNRSLVICPFFLFQIVDWYPVTMEGSWASPCASAHASTTGRAEHVLVNLYPVLPR